MGKVIRAFDKLNKQVQYDLYDAFYEGELERTVFPYKGAIQDGVIYTVDGDTFLVPISTIVAMMSGLAEDDDDDSSSDSDSDSDTDFEDMEEDEE